MIQDKAQQRNMKEQGKGSPSKANFTTKDLHNSEKEEISIIDLKK
jgi:hypothetical protein